jgi:selenocysteine-specific elongation factor
MNHVVGTAGHVDHGKSSLVLALTGTDPDRLAEEKRRGMTIELGFASWQLPGGDSVGMIDVPGHRRFIRTMLAGAHGIDLVLLVVAADEGVMPQTREHLAICELLGARHAVVALTKSDLVDEETLELARAEVEEVIAASGLGGAPVVPCSSLTRAGLDVLASTVEKQLARVPAAVDRGRPRLFVDRCFAVAGFGTVVTGTQDGGSFHTGEEVSVLPEALPARIRGLQHHGADVSAAEPGRRTAVNLVGVGHRELRRGMALVRPGSLAPTARLDVHLAVLDDAPAAIAHRGSVVLFLGTAEVAAQVWLLEGTELGRGEEGFAQLHLAAPICAAHHDRFVLRRATPPATLGGGMVVDVAPRRHRRRDIAVAASLQQRRDEGVEVAVREELRKQRLGGDIALLARAVGAGHSQVTRALADLGDAVVTLGRRWLAIERWDDLRQKSATTLAAYHQAEPLRSGMPQEEWRSRLRLPGSLASDVAHRLAAAGALMETDGQIALPGRGPTVSAATQIAADSVMARLDARPLDPPSPAELAGDGLTPPLLRHLLEERRVVRLSPAVVLSRQAFEAARAQVVEHLERHGQATVAELRDALGATRRVVVPLLEALDAEKVTLRDGDRRRLRRGAESAS